ncbi:uncharacterized protein LOC129001720 [Macrosteles quadrilineatus]|uniref:uncharacterized protein LOC129001720 n=1 Tax=Macrosteles quadrilineatus TaxID=74068 RepID=UPI0023E172F6|nr:uncharacterized protein LOC129001720 [Macrosteles quadrilineatus]
MWVVACFLQENNTIEVVPQCWVKDDKCFWPIVARDKLKRFIEGQVRPDEDGEWQLYDVRIIGKPYDNVQKARQRANVALTRSDIDTDDNLKRKAKPNKKYFNLSPSSSESSLNSSVSHDDEPSSKKAKKCLWAQTEKTSKKNTSPLKRPKPFPHTSMHARKSPKKPHIESKIEENRRNNIESPASSKTDSNSGKKAEESFETICIRNQNFIKEMLLTIRGDLSKLQEKIANIEQARLITEVQLTQKVSEFVNHLPCKTLEELNELEDNLADKKKETEMINYLVRVGGANAADCCRRALRASITDEVACLYSWAGQKGKRVFSRLKLRMAISKAVIASFPEATEKVVEGGIKDWLRPSTNRLLSKQKRKPVEGGQEVGDAA